MYERHVPLILSTALLLPSGNHLNAKTFRSVSNVRVVAGMFNYKIGGSQTLLIAEVIIHPDYHRLV